MNETFLPFKLFSSEPKRNLDDEPKGDLGGIYDISSLSVGFSVDKDDGEGLFNSQLIKLILERSLNQILYQNVKRFVLRGKSAKSRQENTLKQSLDMTTKVTVKSSAFDLVESLKYLIFDLKEEKYTIIPETLICMLTEESPPKFTPQHLDKLEGFFKDQSCEKELKRYYHLLLIMCYDSTTTKRRLVELCNDLISSYYFKSEDLIFISTQLSILGENSKDFELLRDAFILISYSNLIYPTLSDKLMVVIGERLLDLSQIMNDGSNHNLLFIEFVSRRISSCNNGTPNMARIFCSIHRENVDKKLREPLLKDNGSFAEQIETILNKPLKTKYYEEYINKFLTSNNPKYLYKALNSVYLTDSKEIILNKASRLGAINLHILSKNFRMDDLELSVLFYNCIHNYHIIFDMHFESVEYSINSSFRTNIVNIKGYFEAVKHFLTYYFDNKINFNTRLITDFKVKFHSLFIKTIKNNLRKITEQIKTIESKVQKNEYCEQYKQKQAEIQTNCLRYIEECFSDFTLRWENQSERYLFYRVMKEMLVYHQ